MRKMMRIATSAAAGATAAYFFDPIAGKGRRSRVRDQMAARARKAGRQVKKRIRYEAGRAKGKVYEATGLGGRLPIDEQTLVQKIRSEALGPAGVSARDVAVEVDIDTGEVVLRGHVDDQLAWDDLARRVGEVTGVEAVRTVHDLNSSRV